MFTDIGGVTRYFAQPTQNPTRSPTASRAPTAPTPPTAPTTAGPTLRPTTSPTLRPTFTETARPTNAVLQLTPTHHSDDDDDDDKTGLYLALTALGLIVLSASYVALRRKKSG